MAVRLAGRTRAALPEVRPDLVVVAPRGATPPRRHYVVPKVVCAAADAAAIALAMAAAYWTGGVRHVVPRAEPGGTYLLFALGSIPVWLCVFTRYGLYSSRRITSRYQEYRAVFHAVVVAVVAMTLGAYTLKLGLARRWLLLTCVYALVTVVAERDATRRVFQLLRGRGRMMRPIVIVGANGEGRGIAQMLASEPWLGYRVLGFVDDHPTSDGALPMLGSLSTTLAVVLQTGATGVIIATTAVDADTCNDIARQLTDAGLHVELSSTLRDIASQRLLVRPLGRYPVVCLEPIRRAGWRGAAKRVWDVALALIGLIVLAPFGVLVALVVKLDSPGPVFFRQWRIGKDGQPFKIVKFRTMTVDAELRLADLRSANEADGPLFKIRDDPRMTRAGRVLRRLSIDEFPQLWNVLRGDMSMVGPRPALPAEAVQWQPRLRQRLRVKPGLTGMWQVQRRGVASFEQYERLDLYYVDNWSLLTDLFVILRTIPIVLRGGGV